MKNIKLALMAGAAVAVSAAAAHADELQDLKAQIEALNARVAAMETAPSVPAGYRLLAVSKGEALEVPGLGQSDKDRVSNSRATIISVMPTADAPAGTTISWSGYVRAAVTYNGNNGSTDIDKFTRPDSSAPWAKSSVATDNKKKDYDLNDWDVKSRGQLRVVATTDTAVGEVGVELKLRGDVNGNTEGKVYIKTAWGYWAMTPELTLGGGYSGSLGNIGYGYDGACTCYYTDNADVGFNPGDTTQLRVSYASGPFSAAVAVEDAAKGDGDANDNYAASYNALGAAGEIKYSGDTFSGEISGVYRGTTDAYDPKTGKNIPSYGKNVDGLWQVGAGVGFNLGDMASLSLAAALGQGPYELVNSDGQIDGGIPIYNSWWGVSGLASVNLSDTVHAEAAAGYKSRSGDDADLTVLTGAAYDVGTYDVKGIEYETYAFLGGVYYTPVDQLTIGIEGEWYNTQWDTTATGKNVNTKYKLDSNIDNWTVDLVSVWRF